MFWSKKEVPEVAEGSAAEEVGLAAEGFYRSGRMHCAEAVFMAVRERFCTDVPPELIRVAAGFGGGSGTGCLCGAVSGGTMALGLALGSDKQRVKELTRELHHWFKEEYGATCCKLVLQAHSKKVCPELTGRVAGKVAEMLS